MFLSNVITILDWSMMGLSAVGTAVGLYMHWKATKEVVDAGR